MLPDAFVFNYAGGDGNLVLAEIFRANPNFRPPSLEARVFMHMEGEMWVDCNRSDWLRSMVTSIYGFGLLDTWTRRPL